MYSSKLNLSSILAIIAILAVVALLLMPVREQPPRSKVAACLSNIKQQCLSEIMYTADNDDRLPNCEAWMDLCTPYIKNQDALHCPVIDRTHPDQYGYAMHSKMSEQLTTKIPDPADRVLILESAIMDRNASSLLVGFPNPSRHKRNTLAFADGHVKADISLAKYR